MTRHVLAPHALRDLRTYAMHVRVAAGAAAALREWARVEAELAAFADGHADGTPATVHGLPEGLRCHYLHPFHVYYRREPSGLYVHRLHHHARRPLTR